MVSLSAGMAKQFLPDARFLRRIFLLPQNSVGTLSIVEAVALLLSHGPSLNPLQRSNPFELSSQNEPDFSYSRIERKSNSSQSIWLTGVQGKPMGFSIPMLQIVVQPCIAKLPLVDHKLLVNESEMECSVL
jgi:hypothetical protein